MTTPTTTHTTTSTKNETAIPPGTHELLITRTFAAPRELVFQIWETREQLIRWWGPKDFTCTHVDLDFRVGGSYRICIVSAQYGESWMSGRFLEIERPRRIAMTFAWEHESDQPGVETKVTVTFEEVDGKTVQRFHQTPFLHEAYRDGHIGGWNECFDGEQAYVEALAQEAGR